MSSRVFIAIIVLSFLLLPFARAQNEAALSGTVTDTTGAVVPNATVKLTSHEQGTVRTVQTNQAGVYQFSFLPPGTYDLDVSANGFKTVNRTNETLAVAQNARLDFSLEVGNVSENVTVSASTESVNTESAEVGAVVDNTRVVEMPLNGRTFYSLAPLVPNVTPPAQGSSLSYRGGFNVAGNAEANNNFTVNGFDNTDTVTAQPNFRPSIDAIQEFNVLTGVYPAQYGWGSGGQIIVTLKSGGNQFHGTAFDFLRNQAIMTARNFFALPGPVPSFKRNQFGGTVGGPIQKDKTFFFFSYEGLRLSQAVLAGTTVPTSAMDAGDFSATGKTIKDPTTGNPFAGDVISASLFNAVGRKLISYFPAPTAATPFGQLPANNYTFSETRIENMNEDSLKIDHSFGQKDSIYATANYFNDPSYEPSNQTCGSRVLPTFGCNQNQRSELYGLSETHIFSPSLVNEARAGWTDIIQPRVQENQDNFWGPFGIIQTVTSWPMSELGVPNTSVTGYAALGVPTNIPQRRADPDWIFNDSVSWTHGKHTIKIGGNSTHLRTNNYTSSNVQGTLSFSNTSQGPTTGNAVSDILLGLPTSTANTPYQYTVSLATMNIDAFIQDDYKVSGSLTLNLGLRWELNTPPITQDGRMTSFNPVTGLPVTQANPAPVQAPGASAPVGFQQHVYHFDWHDYAPRIGFAWQPFHDGKTVVRGGAGTFFNATTVNSLYSSIAGYPYKVSYTYTSSLAQPISLSNPFPSSNAVTNVSLTGFDPNFRNARVYEWTIGFQRQLTSSMLFEADYFASSGSHIKISQNINQPAPGPGTPAQVNARRPYPIWNTVTWTQWDGNSHYQSLQAKLQQRYSFGLSFLAAFTFGKSIDDTNSATNAYNFQTARGLSTFNTPYRLVFSPVYELPFGKGRPWVSSGVGAAILGGWEVSSLIQWQTGQSLTPTLAGNFSNSGGTTDRPNVICNPNSNAPHTPAQWFNTSCFSFGPASGQPGASYSFGNAGVGIIQGPGFFNVDATLVRTFSVKERVKIQFRLEIYDLFNHPNFSGTGTGSTTLDTIVTNATFGRILGAADPRESQLALKIVF